MLSVNAPHPGYLRQAYQQAAGRPPASTGTTYFTAALPKK